MNESFISRVIQAHRITIPKKIREKFAIMEGDWVEVLIVRKIERLQKESVVQ